MQNEAILRINKAKNIAQEKTIKFFEKKNSKIRTEDLWSKKPYKDLATTTKGKESMFGYVSAHALSLSNAVLSRCSLSKTIQRSFISVRSHNDSLIKIVAFALTNFTDKLLSKIFKILNISFANSFVTLLILRALHKKSD